MEWPIAMTRVESIWAAGGSFGSSFGDGEPKVVVGWESWERVKDISAARI
jgi:hypothetical protein